MIMNTITNDSKVIADLIKERDELKEFSCQLYSVITQLQKERDALKAHCEELLTVSNKVKSQYAVTARIDMKLWNEFGEVTEKTPQQSLNEIKAQAIKQAK
jgi:hypothetical protein